MRYLHWQRPPDASVENTACSRLSVKRVCPAFLGPLTGLVSVGLENSEAHVLPRRYGPGAVSIAALSLRALKNHKGAHRFRNQPRLIIQHIALEHGGSFALVNNAGLTTDPTRHPRPEIVNLDLDR